MRKVLLQRKQHQNWTWMLIITFFVLSNVNVYFGLLGFACMGAPFYHAIKGHGKLHCSHYCPRGSFFGKFLDKISMQNSTPLFMRTTWFKNLVFVMMMASFGLMLVRTGGDIQKIAYGVTRMMLSSFIVGVVFGVFTKPRGWCQICPMGHGAGLVKKAVNKSKDTELATKKN